MAKHSFKHGSSSRDNDEGVAFGRKDQALEHVEMAKESGAPSMASMHGREMKKHSSMGKMNYHPNAKRQMADCE